MRWWLGLLLTVTAGLYTEPGLTREQIIALETPRVLRAAKAALKAEPINLTQFPAKLSEGGPQDFYSNGDYWWPDPTKPNGLPYLRRDGQTNPENFSQHRLAMKQFRDHVAALAVAYQLTHDEVYAQQAVRWVDTFLLNPKTGMHPHLQYAQAIPGRNPGRGIGIIDSLHLIEIPPALKILATSPALTPARQIALKQWFQALEQWMLTSKNGQEEAAEKNNHAVAFWLQVAVYADYVQDTAALDTCRRQFTENFIGKQMANDGSFPLELARTKPYGYSIFQLDNMATLAHVLSTPQLDLWHYALPDSRGMNQACAYLTPYIQDKSKWPLKPDIQAWEAWPARPIYLLFAGQALQRPDYLKLWSTLEADPTDPEVQRNRAITQPLLWLRAP
jgi:hypothetical protein